jgi:hypothetical protein
MMSMNFLPNEPVPPVTRTTCSLQFIELASTTSSVRCSRSYARQTISASRLTAVQDRLSSTRSRSLFARMKGTKKQTWLVPCWGGQLQGSIAEFRSVRILRDCTQKGRFPFTHDFSRRAMLKCRKTATYLWCESSWAINQPSSRRGFWTRPPTRPVQLEKVSNVC